MNINGAKIFNQGVLVDHDCEEKIKQLVNTFKAVSDSPEINIQFLKRGRIYEGLLWGKASSIPVGIYRQGVSVSQVLDHMQKRAQKDCLKILKQSGHAIRHNSCDLSTSAMAG